MGNNLTQTAWADHLLGCADVAIKVAERLGLRDNAAVQACFATVTIDATKHNIFMEPTPRNGKTAVVDAPPASTNGVVTEHKNAEPMAIAPEPLPRRATPPKGEIAEVNQGAIKDATAEQAESANRTALIEGVNSAVKLLNKEGYTPPMTPKSLNKFIEGEVKDGANLGSLDADELGELLKKLNAKIETFRSNKKIADEDPF